MAVTMPQERGFPPNTPFSERERQSAFQPCPYCSFETKFQEALKRHINRFHEGALAQEGERVRERGREKWASTQQFLLAHGYIKCQFWPALCPGQVNPLMRRLCQHQADCPEEV